MTARKRFHLPSPIGRTHCRCPTETLRRSLWLAIGLLLIIPGVAMAVQYGMITIDRLNVRPEPNMDRPPIKVLERDTQVRILRLLDGWIEIDLGNRTGYIRNRKKYVIIVDDRPGSDAGGGETRAKIDRFQKEAEQIHRRMKQRKDSLDKVTRQEKEVIDRLNDIGLALNHSRKQIAKTRSSLTSLGLRIQAISEESAVLEKDILELERYAAKRLVAYYKLSWLGKLHVLASAGSVAELFHRKAAMERVLEYDDTVWDTLKTKREKLRQNLADLHVRRSRQKELENELRSRIKSMAEEQNERNGLLEKIRQEKSLELATIASLKKASEDLDRILRSLKQEADIASSEKSIDTKRFIDFKGLLKMPVEGTIVNRFGPYKDKRLNVVHFRSGIDIRADRGEPIRAVSAGRVLYADWLKGYGNMIIIDHGQNYYTVYAHAEDLFKRKGEPVDTDEVIATVGDTGSLAGPRLYFEVRHHGKPLDPLKWMRTG
ncbi:Murein hydrolase activator EnvC [Olavius algarvensis associated proteobacterium Delta 3]|nr:Murein hydrolase activator EnvC [Olavius algarvensis associated proteobacterium Delta 3]